MNFYRDKLKWEYSCCQNKFNGWCRKQLETEYVCRTLTELEYRRMNLQNPVAPKTVEECFCLPKQGWQSLCSPTHRGSAVQWGKQWVWKHICLNWGLWFNDFWRQDFLHIFIHTRKALRPFSFVDRIITIDIWIRFTRYYHMYFYFLHVPEYPNVWWVRCRCLCVCVVCVCIFPIGSKWVRSSLFD